MQRRAVVERALLSPERRQKGVDDRSEGFGVGAIEIARGTYPKWTLASNASS